MINVYIDVDGVINSFNRTSMAGWKEQWQLAEILGYQIHWYPDLIEELNKLSKREDVTFKWLTTWQNDAVEHLCPQLGIEGTEWEVLYAEDEDSLFDLRDWWKLRAIIKDVEKTAPDGVVWIDDDIKYEGKALQWVRQDNILAISPFTSWGMTKEDFSDIIDFISKIS